MSKQQSADPAPVAVPSYRERLWVPVGWWVLAALFALSLLAAVLFYLGPIAGLLTGVAVMLVLASGFVGYGRAAVAVTPDRLLAAGATIEWRYVDSVHALDAVQTRQRRGPGADARAYLVLRPYLQRAVEVRLDDPQDPTPYWLINSRHPDRLAAAITGQLPERPDDEELAEEAVATASETPHARDTLKP